MSIPTIQKTKIGGYILKQKLSGKKRYPLVLMLEPLFLCNLSCRGCGKGNYPEALLKKRLSVEDCVQSVKECSAPVVSIPGGEPLLHPDMPVIVRKLIKMKKFVYLCTNALLINKRIDEFEPSVYLTFNVHLDGLKDRHDFLVNRQGVFDTAVDAIRLLTAKGFRVTTNTTFYYGETADNATRFLDFLTSLGVEGMTISPCFSYENATDREISLRRKATQKLFSRLLQNGRGRGWQFNHSSLYLEFLAGNQNYSCTPWGNPTRNIFGWQKPCYLLSDGYVETFQELMETTKWYDYGVGNDPRCRDCMVHCGFEPTAVNDAFARPLKALVTHTKKVYQENTSHGAASQK